MTAVPRRGRDLTGEVFERRALAFGIVCHAVSGNSIPNSVDVRLGTHFRSFAASIGNRDVAGRLAGDRRGRLLVEVGDGADPGVGCKLVVVEVKLAVLVANGLHEAGAGVISDYRVECSHRAENVGAATYETARILLI